MEKSQNENRIKSEKNISRGTKEVGEKKKKEGRRLREDNQENYEVEKVEDMQ